MFDQVVSNHDNKKMDLNVAKLQFYQICHTNAYLHNRNVCYMYLKLKNILQMESCTKSLVKGTYFHFQLHQPSRDIRRDSNVQCTPARQTVGTCVWSALQVVL